MQMQNTWPQQLRNYHFKPLTSWTIMMTTFYEYQQCTSNQLDVCLASQALHFSRNLFNVSSLLTFAYSFGISVLHMYAHKRLHEFSLLANHCMLIISCQHLFQGCQWATCMDYIQRPPFLCSIYMSTQTCSLSSAQLPTLQQTITATRSTLHPMTTQFSSILMI